MPGKSASDVSTRVSRLARAGNVGGRTELPVLGVELLGVGERRRSGHEERPEDQVGVREEDVREDLEGALVRRCLAWGE